MVELPPEFVVFDLEWTAWEGSQARQWSGPGEVREIYDIGAVFVDGRSLTISGTFRQLIKLELVSALPAYSTNLTGITQQELDRDGVLFTEAIQAFYRFSQKRPLYCWGTDNEVIAENCRLKKVEDPFAAAEFHNMREFFKQHGVPAEKYMSSTIVEYFGKRNVRPAHQGVEDAQNIVEALRLLQAQLGSNLDA